MLYNVVEVETIKLAVNNIEYHNISGKDVLIDSVVWLTEKYENTGENRFLLKAISHIYAYLDLGYSFQTGEKEFEKVLGYMGKTADEVFPKEQWQYNRIRINKVNIRNLLGRWNPGLHSMKITDAVNDIYAKSTNKQTGRYIYHSGKILESQEDYTLWENTFELTIEEEIIFHDVNNNKYYILG